MALLGVLTMVLTSCSNDDKPMNNGIEIKSVEMGHHNSKKGTIGSDLHLECNIVSMAKIKEIHVTLIKDEKNKVEKVYNDAKYSGVLNTNFHEHLNLPENLEEGEYVCAIIVTNVDGGISSVQDRVTLKKKQKDADVPVIANLKTDKMEGVAKGKVTITADIETKAAVKEIEIEFHGAKEHELEISDLNGKTGKLKFQKEVTIPAECTPGKYHIHFTVTDAAGRKTTEEIEDFVIK